MSSTLCLEPARCPALWMLATFSSPCWHAVSCDALALPRSTSTASTWRRLVCAYRPWCHEPHSPDTQDAAFARRFQEVFVAEPSIEDTVAILRGLKEKYEAYHGVRVLDNALVAAARLSDRYLTQRFLPDKVARFEILRSTQPYFPALTGH